MIAAIVGAGAIGASIASALTVRDRIREIRLIDEAGAVAAGKALDIRQATPVHGADVRLTGTTALEGVAGADVVAVADAHGSPSIEWQGEAGLALLTRILSANPRAPVVFAGATQAWLLERAVAELGVPPGRVIGSAPIALEAAVRGLVAAEAAVSPHVVALALAGRPPDRVVVAWDAAMVDGTPLTRRLDAGAVTRLTRRLPFLWPPGPMALGVAAALVIDGLTSGSRRSVAALVARESAGGGCAAVVASVDLEPGRVGGVRLPALSTVEQVALDNALGARR